MPYPVSGESWREFVARCMSDDEAVEDFPDTDQRLAFCSSVWERREKEEENGND
jgi:hypothetical protein